MTKRSKNLLRWLKYAAYFTAGTYVLDVIVRPHLAAQDALAFAKSVGKPVINVGAGTPGSSMRVALMGPTLWGDVNIDIAADKSVRPGPSVVSYGDAHRLPYRNKQFGALIASHVLEHLDDPHAALAEWSRVADRVFVTVPKWWAPHTWLHPGHHWYIDGATMTPLRDRPKLSSRNA